MSGTMIATRMIEGVETPAPGVWELDSNHTSITAVGRHAMISRVRGTFHEFSGAIHVAERPQESWVELTIRASSIDSGVQMRDDHMRSPDFLDVERFPQITYRSTAVELLGGGRLRVTGDLTIRDVTRPVVLDVEFQGVAKDPFGRIRAGFTATGELEREAWGMTWNQALETGGWLVSKTLKLEIEAAAIHQGDASA